MPILTDADIMAGPAEDYPGWFNWSLQDPTRFNTAVMGRVIMRKEENKARVRMFPERRHSNMFDGIHGGMIMAMVDIALFPTLYLLSEGADKAATFNAVTIEASTQFIGAGRIGEPLDAVGELMHQTGRMAFLRGVMEQDGTLVATWSGTGAQTDETMTSLLARYEAMVASGELRPDPEQAAAAESLHRLQRALESAEASTGFLGRLLKKKRDCPRGIYMWGGVGRGKSMLMDLFHDTLAIKEKRRVHFHAFMLEVHARLRDERRKETGDPILPVAAALGRELRCLAFDEMVVNNSADAMIMSRLFTSLIVDEGVTIVTTSNRAPDQLYKDGLNREHFLPFIGLIERELDVLTLNGPVDYRLERLGGMATWHTPLGQAATDQVTEAFFRLTDYPPEDRVHVPSTDIDVGGGRMLHVPKSLKGVGVFSFKRLCGEARGAADYLAIAHAYHTVIIVGIPQMGPENRNEAARFVTMIDALYENRVKLIATAAAEPEELYEAGDGRFEFERTVSRLNEMQSADYLAQGHGEA